MRATRREWCGGVLALVGGAVLGGCGRAADAGGARDAAVRAAVARWARPPAGLPVGEWTYAVTSVDGAAGTARARLRWSLRGIDGTPVTAERALRFTGTAGAGVRVLGDGPAPGARAQLWDAGSARALPARHGIVLDLGRPAGEAEAVAALLDRAVPAAARAWPRRDAGSGRVAVCLPATGAALASLLGGAPGAYAGLAAVTDGATGALADRVLINPEVWPGLSEAGRRVVLTHEVTHVLTRSATTGRTPPWLSEGFAEWAAQREEPGPPERAAPELARAVRAGRVPDALPDPAAFAFGGGADDAEAPARAYAGAWLACRLLARRWGDAALVRLYEEAGREGAPAALRAVTGLTEREFTAAWRAELREVFGARA
ncbi:hypothetical protein ACN20G_19870 [Streptomyces sp. BI20]|uniref:hypothetical protein n=1 Tax=Streptomyces sp. BI20 TaxID=3403460 RepID=UPI003C78CDB9